MKPLKGPIPTLPVVPAFEVESMCFRPPRRPSKHRRRGLSDTPRPASDPPPTDLCRRSDPVISGMIAIDTCRKPCRDPRRDVDIVFVDASLSTQHVVKPVLNAVPGGPYILKNRAIYTGSHDPGMPKNKVTRLKSFRNHFSGMFHDFSFLDRGNQYILKTSVNDYSP